MFLKISIFGFGNNNANFTKLMLHAPECTLLTAKNIVKAFEILEVKPGTGIKDGTYFQWAEPDTQQCRLGEWEARGGNRCSDRKCLS